MRRYMMKRVGILLSLSVLLCADLSAQVRSGSDTPKIATISEKVAGMQKYPGYFPFYWDAKAGKIWLEIDKWNSEFLYVESLPAGCGLKYLCLDPCRVYKSYLATVGTRWP